MKYHAKGDIRGCCGHKHRTIRTAAKCTNKDRVGCRRQGGYSDRRVTREDGEPLSDVEMDCLSHHQQTIDQLGCGCGCPACEKLETPPKTP